MCYLFGLWWVGLIDWTSIMWKCDWCRVTLNLINAPNIFCFKTCKIYLCGTKKDLVDADKRLRQVDYHTTTDYADGLYYWIVKFLLIIIFTVLCLKLSMNGHCLENYFQRFMHRYLKRQAKLEKILVSFGKFCCYIQFQL